jgi:hypothetical protein
VKDPIYVRVCIALVSLLFAGGFCLLLPFCFFPLTAKGSVLGLICTVVILIGVYGLYFSIFSSDRSIGQAMCNFSLGAGGTAGQGDIVGLLFLILILTVIFLVVGIVAIPITVIIKCFMPRKFEL